MNHADSLSLRWDYLVRKYARHPFMLFLTFGTIIATVLLVVEHNGISPGWQMILCEDCVILLWMILFFFFSDKLLFLCISRGRFEQMKKRMRYLLNENSIFIASIVFLIILSVLSLVAEIVLVLPKETLSILRTLDFTILWIFLFEFYLRYLSAGENKVTHFTKAETIVDLLALFPILRIFRLMRFIRLFRFLRIAKFKRYFQALADSMTVLATLWSENVFYLVIIFILISIFLIFGAVTTYHIEKSVLARTGSFFDALWWSVSLLFAGQPLDIHPASRIVGFVLIMSGIIITSILTGTIAATLSERIQSVKSGDIHYNFRGHILICGWRSEATDLILYIHQHMGKRKRHIVVVDDTIDELPPMEKDVYFVKGNPASESALLRANAHEASAVIILSGKDKGLLGDQRTILSTLAVESLSRSKSGRDIHTCAEIKNSVNIRNLERAYVNEIILVDEYYTDILAQSALIPGLIDFLDELLTNQKEDNNIYKIRGQEFAGKSFEEIYHDLAEKNIVPIGVLREEKKPGMNGESLHNALEIPELSYRTYINPENPGAFKLSESDQIFVVSRPDDIRGWEVVID